MKKYKPEDVELFVGGKVVNPFGLHEAWESPEFECEAEKNCQQCIYGKTGNCKKCAGG